MYTVAIFLCDRAYGGPEEGGWYYDCGEPSNEHANQTRGFQRERDAARYATKLDETVVRALNVGRRSISSVLSEGRYAAVVCDGNPKPYPLERPRYE